MLLATLPTLGLLPDGTVETDGNGFDFQAFLESSSGQNLTANILNMVSRQSGTAPIFKTPSGAYQTPAAGVDPLWVIGGVIGLGLLLAMRRK
ncbi:MAG: hypothetical protein WCP34_15200 [Pseudomonadota bacterium]